MPRPAHGELHTQEDIGGARTESINAAELLNAPDVTVFVAALPAHCSSRWRRSSGGWTVNPPSVSSIPSPSWETGGRTNACARVQCLRVAPGHSQIAGADLDVRDEVMAQIFDPGDPVPKRTLTFSIEVTDEGRRRNAVPRPPHVQKLATHRIAGVRQCRHFRINGDAVIHSRIPPGGRIATIRRRPRVNGVKRAVSAATVCRREVAVGMTFIWEPGLAGPFGALMDECARASDEFCRVVEGFDAARFVSERASNTRRPDAACRLHPRLWRGEPIRALHPKGRGLDFVERYQLDPERLHAPQEVRALLTEGTRLMEETVAPLRGATDSEIQAFSFNVRWGPRYDPEMILEHAVCHLLRHRRQLERW
jgi:hypothetical protein